MKIIVQNGANHLVTRNVIEQLKQDFPENWDKHVKTILIYSTLADTPVIKYFPKSKEISVCGTQKDESVFLILQELLISISVIVDKGDLPSRLSKQLYDYHLKEIASLLPEFRHTAPSSPSLEYSDTINGQ